jgi:hypothetical protein
MAGGAGADRRTATGRLRGSGAPHDCHLARRILRRYRSGERGGRADTRLAGWLLEPIGIPAHFGSRDDALRQIYAKLAA